MLRPKLGRIWGQSSANSRRDPGDAKYLIGWLSEIPTYQVLNYLQWKADTTALALAERGVFEWGSDVTYKKNAAVWDESDGQVYVALLNGPSKDLKPSSNLSQWATSAIQISRKSFDDAVSAINTHVADITGNPHKLTPERLGTYTVAQINSLVAQYKAMVTTHASDTNNPHKLTAAGVGAVPITGGTYTGTVTMGTGRVNLGADAAVASSGAGVYMGNSAGQIGVSPTGVGFVKVGSAAASNIVTQSTFADNKALVEPLYATPYPIFNMPMMNDINVYIGSGYVTLQPVSALFDTSGRWGIPRGLETENVKIICTPAIFSVATPSVTLAVDIKLVLTNPGVAEWGALGVGTNLTGNTNPEGRIHIGISGTGALRVQNSDFRINTADVLADLALHRIVVRKTPQDMQLYIDGVLIQTVVGANKPIGPAATDMYLAGYSAVSNFGGSACNFRVWDSALSATQISAL